MKAFIRWTCEGLLHGLILYCLSSVYYHGKPSDNFEFGIGCYTSIVLVVTARLAVETSCWTWLTHLVLWGTVIRYFQLIFR